MKHWIREYEQAKAEEEPNMKLTLKNGILQPPNRKLKTLTVALIIFLALDGFKEYSNIFTTLPTLSGTNPTAVSGTSTKPMFVIFLFPD